ncbi:MAG TPA: M48 family metalloprotease [Chlamydiales bacterium]|jgi:predicted Zn-dependent protease|nr:M48 family metalloprotease [Chlamydiales bacterium]
MPARPVGSIPITSVKTPSEKSTSCCQQIVDVICKIAQCIFAPFIALYHWVCPINPVTQSREFKIIPSCVEKFIGKAAYAPLVQRSGGEIFATHPLYGKYAELVQEVGTKLAKECPRKDLAFKFVVLDSQEPNAWSLPGGYFGVNLGLMQKIELETSDYDLGYHPSLAEKVAAVLSHEITHAAARHGGRKIELSLFLFVAIQAVKYAFSYFVRRNYDSEIKKTNDPVHRAQLIHKQNLATENCLTFLNPLGSWLLSSLSLCGSRSHELEADKFGMHLLAKMQDAPFNKNSPRAAVWLMHYFKHHHSTKTNIGWVDCIRELFYTHPTPEERLAANIQTWKTLQSMRTV